ncbi:MAG: DUF4419 domain-containing protein [Muribaculaceae bacterium]|nr:DUF4419 domain-containing protein [Muribaculaceae bacterium]
MAKTYLFLLLALVSLTALANDSRIIAQSPGSISFVVDENLQPVDYEFTLTDGGEIAKLWMTPPMDMTLDEAEKNNSLVASSFANEHNLEYQGEGPFFSTLITAYANHMSVTLSPDMVWLLISQGFARYVDSHAEELRSLFVDHDGKMKLTVQGTDILFEHADWPKLIGTFASLIEKNTKGGIAQVITADFSTTGPVERVASQITLMKSMEHYFEYYYFTICGIPSITLKGTPEDWQRVLEKTQKLSQYGLDGWVKELEPILTEFIHAAQGHPNQRFWQCIVKKIREDELRGAGDGCGDETEPTVLDGWFLKLYPNWDGKTYPVTEYKQGGSMGSEIVRVEFNYDLLGLMSFPMELWAGFIGTEVDTTARMLTPKIGWMAILCENKMKTKDAALYTVQKQWVLSLCLTVLVISILGLIVWIVRKLIKSRRKSK